MKSPNDDNSGIFLEINPYHRSWVYALAISFAINMYPENMHQHHNSQLIYLPPKKAMRNPQLQKKIVVAGNPTIRSNNDNILETCTQNDTFRAAPVPLSQNFVCVKGLFQQAIHSNSRIFYPSGVQLLLAQNIWGARSRNSCFYLERTLSLILYSLPDCINPFSPDQLDHYLHFECRTEFPSY
jgi:hypothetical protein